MGDSRKTPMKIESGIFLILMFGVFSIDYDDEHRCTKAISGLTASGKFLCISPGSKGNFAVSTNKNIFKKPLTCKQAANR